MPSEWADPLRELYLHLVRNDEEFELLQDIDRCAANLELSLKDTLLSTASRLAKLTKSAYGYLYVFDGSHFRLASGINDGSPPLRMNPEDVITDSAYRLSNKLVIVSKDDFTPTQKGLFPISEGIAGLLLSSSNDRRFGLVLFDSREPRESSVVCRK